MSEKNFKELTQDELEEIQKAIGNLNEAELQQIVGAGGDVNVETTIVCAGPTITKLTTAMTKRPFCK